MIPVPDQKCCKKCQTDKPLTEFYKHATNKDKLMSLCKVCSNKRSSDLYFKKHTENRKRLSDYYWANHEAEKEARRQHYRKNKTTYLVANYRRDIRVKLATPSWLTDEMKLDMLHLYQFRKILSDETLVEYHVDHIVPLHGESVCGLNVPWNLQLMRAQDNLRKGKKHHEG